MRASQFPATLTADELLHLSSPNGERYELVEGVLEVREPPGWEHGFVEHRIDVVLGAYVDRQKLGTVLVGDPGCLTRGDNLNVRGPDVAFISFERLPPGPLPRGYGSVAPDLVVEVLSPDDRPAQVAEKVREWLAFGVSAVWVVDPRERAVRVHEGGEVSLLGEHDTLDGGRAVPGFSAPVRSFFEG
jgi:Uma2 family endonuclease